MRQSPKVYSAKWPEPETVSNPAIRPVGTQIHYASVPAVLHVAATRRSMFSPAAHLSGEEALARPTPLVPPGTRAYPDSGSRLADRAQRDVVPAEEGVVPETATRARPYAANKTPYPAPRSIVLQVRLQHPDHREPQAPPPHAPAPSRPGHH